jgi:hypothetical protein
MSHNDFAFSADRDHSVRFKVERDQAAVGLNALLVQGRQGGFGLGSLGLQRL